ncbi:uncharacterized protein [Nerophis lumbriciformis]|uniref:uncharacterized protein isoform X2 n=1 Tax=Nerophis lumbriciformis TaxID=546530 RepID=UPI002ADF4586|nr:zinc finger and SCAN domain-containing protein 2-like isoform X2 [Nerophis lumbriciformis]
MCKVKKLRALMEQRLNSVVEEIFGLFERTIAEYEEELSSTRKDYERQRHQLDAVLKPPVRLHGAGIQRVLAESQGEGLSKEQEWRADMGQDEPEPPQIKEDEEELWEEFQVLEADVNKLTFPGVLVKSEDSEDDARQSLQLLPSQSAENTGIQRVLAESQEEGLSKHHEPEPPHIKEEEGELWEEFHVLESDVINKLTFPGVFGKSEDSDHDARQSLQLLPSKSAGNRGAQPQSQHVTEGDGDDMSDSSETELSNEVQEAAENNNDSKGDMRHHTDNKHFVCSECGKSFDKKGNLNRHIQVHTGEKPFACSVCAKRFSSKCTLKRHMMIHTGENPFSCSVCAKRFRDSYELMLHMRIHTGEKPFSCSICRNNFSRKLDMLTHMRSHMEKQCVCSLCPKRFTSKKYAMIHMRTHTGEKPFSCNVCDKRFTYRYQVSRHKCVTVMEAART